MRGRLKSACAASAASAPMNVVARRGLFGLLLSLFILLLRQSAECSPLFLSSSRCLPFPVTVSSTHMSIICRSCLPAIHHCCLEMLSRPLTWLSEHLRALSGLPVIVQSSAVRVYQPTFRSCLPALRHCLPALHRCLEMLSRPLSWLSEHLRALSGLPVIVQSSAVRVYQPTFRSCLPALHRCLEMLSRPLSWLSEHLRALSGLPVIVHSSALRVYQPTFRSCLPALRHCLPALHRCLEMLSRPLSWLSEHLRALSGLPVIVHSSALRVYPLLTFNPSLVLVSCRACMLPWSF